MTLVQALYDRYRRYRTLQTHHIKALPVAVLMPHSACNCRCVMCDIWKDNKNLKQLTEQDILHLLVSFKKLGTRQVLMSGGEALLNPNFFRFCRILQEQGIRVTLLSTGLTLKKQAENLLQHVNDIIISLDGDAATHNYIRNIPGAFENLREGVQYLKSLRPSFRITARTVIHKINFRNWPSIIRSAMEMGIDQVSFLPADVSSRAFNREETWSPERQLEILPEKNELPELKQVLDTLISDFKASFSNGFIAERPEKLQRIHTYYAACYGLTPFPYKKCNAPWVSAVIEADGTVRPCFFHGPMGNIRDQQLDTILNTEKSLRFRKELDTDKDTTCTKCVCSLHLSPGTRLH
ncbi:MAG: radical SAM protein [Chitinophagaceae bacterium]